MTTKRAHDPHLEAELERAMKPYNHLPRSMRKAMRDNLARALTEDPVGKTLLDRVRARPLVASSDEMLKEGVAPPAADPAASNGKGNDDKGRGN